MVLYDLVRQRRNCSLAQHDAVAFCASSPTALSGTFLQLNNTLLSRSTAEWSKEFQTMKNLNMDTLVLQRVVNGNVAYYPSKLTGMKVANNSTLLNILTAAQQVGIGVHVGLVWDTKLWHTKTAQSLTALANITIDVGAEIYKLYHSMPSFVGWYLPPEIDNISFKSDTLRQSLVQNYLVPVTSRLRKIQSTWPISTAPFYNKIYMSPEQYGAWWLATLNDTPHLDLLMVQDGVGVGHATIPDAVKYMAALFNATSHATPPRQMWSDVEIFTRTGGESSSGPIDRIVQQLKSEAPYVTKQICFEFHAHMLAAPNATLLLNYMAYLNRQPYPVSLRSGFSDYTLSRPASKAYPDAPHKLTNGQTAFASSNQVGWNGAATISVTLHLASAPVSVSGRQTSTSTFVAYFMRSTASHVGTPTSVLVATSNDGALTFSECGQLQPLTDQNEAENAYVLQVSGSGGCKTAGVTHVRFTFKPSTAESGTVCTQLEAYG